MTSAHAPDRPASGAGSEPALDVRPDELRETREGPSDARALPVKDDPLLGRTLAGKYAIQAIIGEGAMGRVYRARQVALEKDIAVKVLHRHLSGEARIAKRFHREARAASRLSHPNSLHILDFGASDDDVLYIAMELLDGEDLQTILDHDFPLSPARIAAILVPVLRALEEAHRAGIIHRDLKPENVVVLADRSGREHVKVCDFGIAKILDGEEGTSITVDGFVCGTPQYMAPEQARGEEIDHRSDIYAAGVVLYQMLCGSVPFVGENALGTITKHLMEEPVPPRRRRPDLGIPRSLERVCLEALEKDPDERWPSAAAMADAIEAAVSALGAEAEARLGSGPFARHAAEDAAESEAAEVARQAPAEPGDRSRAPLAIGIAIAVAAAIAIAIGTGAGTGSGSGTETRSGTGSGSGTGTETARGAETAAGAGAGARAEPVGTDVAGLAAEERGAAATVGGSPDPEGEDPRAGGDPVVAAAPAVEPARARRGREPAEAARAPEPRAARVEVASAAPVVDDRSPGQVAFDEGRRLFLGNDVPGAIARFEEAARLMPRNPDVQKQLGRAYMRAGDVARSVSAYRRYLALAPDAADRTVVERIIAQHE